MPSPLQPQANSPSLGAREARVERTLFDAPVLLFALWTLAANVVVFAGAGLDDLVWVGAGALALGGALLWRFRAPQTAQHVPSSRAGIPLEAPQVWERCFVLCVTALCLGLLLWRADALVLWTLGGPLCVWCLWRSAAQCEAGEPAAPGSRSRLALWLLAIACLLLTLLAQRADFDDAFYINLAVHAADFPGEALLRADSMHGIEGLPLSLSVYRIQSFELLAAAIAWLTPLDAIECMHVLFPALFSLAIPFALALLLQRVVPTLWLPALCFALLFLFASGDPHRSYGNFSFLRLQQGKSVLLTLVLPLVCYYALRFGERPGLRSFLLLAAVQISALGTNVSALWLAPTCALLSLAASLPLRRGSLRRLLLGLLSCAYPLLAGVILSRSTAANLEATGLRVEPAATLLLWPLLAGLLVLLLGLACSARAGRARRVFGKLSALALALWCVYLAFIQKQPTIEWLQALGIHPAGPESLLACVAQVLGGRWPAALFLFFVLGAWCLAEGALGRRLWALFGSAFLLLFWNPLLAESLAAKLTGGPTYWRVFWVLPAAAMVGSGAAGCVRFARHLALRGGSRAGLWPWAMGTILAAGLVFLPLHSSLSPKNQVFFGSPGLRARQVDLEAAKALVLHAGPGVQVLAPIRVSPWIPTLHSHPFPLMVRRPYMKNLEGHLSKQDIQERSALTRLVSASDLAEGQGKGLQGAELQRLLRGIERYALKGLCLDKLCVGAPLKAALERMGMRMVKENRRYQVWVKV